MDLDEILVQGTAKPRKIRELVADLERAGWFLVTGGKGSHRKFAHSRSVRRLILPGAPGADALHYQEKMVRQALEEIRQ